MRALFLDVASHNGLIACATNEQVVSSIEVDHRIDDQEFLKMIEHALEEAQWTFEDLTHIACVTGPGGFTSLRVGISTANTLAWALGIPSCGIHLSDLYKSRIPLTAGGSHGSHLREEGDMEDIWWLHSTKKSELFIRGFGDYSSIVPEPTCKTINEALDLLEPESFWMGELIPEHHALIEQKGLKEAPLRSITDVLPSFLSSQQYEKKILLPWYGREG